LESNENEHEHNLIYHSKDLLLNCIWPSIFQITLKVFPIFLFSLFTKLTQITGLAHSSIMSYRKKLAFIYHLGLFSLKILLFINVIGSGSILACFFQMSMILLSTYSLLIYLILKITHNKLIGYCGLVTSITSFVYIFTW
jgi:hypothetical protein